MQFLDISENQISDDGMRSLSDTLVKGALAQCQNLELQFNKIGDDGMKAFAEACAAKGALPQLESVDLYGNPGNAELVNSVLRERKGSK